jgi:hypothetical protein
MAEWVTTDLVLRWNAIPEHCRSVDLVLHLHGYAEPAMDLARDKLPISGLDFADPDGVETRNRPTLGILPRGRWFGGRTGRGYDFPSLTQPDGIARLLRTAKAAFRTATGLGPVRSGRRILTAHSGGAAALAMIAEQFRPDEIHVFDGLYAPAPGLIEWAAASLGTKQGALRVLYVPGTGTEAASLEVARALEPLLTDPSLAARWRVDAVAGDHMTMPRDYGWRLLVDAASPISGSPSR